MSNEINVSSTFSAQKRVGNVLVINKNYTLNFRADMEGQAGPSPGVVVATSKGVPVSFSALTTPGFCVITNQGSGDETIDQTCFVEVGVYDQSVKTFIPMIELYPGESTVVRLSRVIGQEYGTSTGGTATPTGGDIQLYVRSAGTTQPTTTQNVAFEAFER